MIALPVTSTVASILAIVMFPMTLQISIRRAALGDVVFGDADDAALRRRVRAFGNFVEYVPLCLVLLSLMEAQGASFLWLWMAGGLLLVGRIIHALGMLFAKSPAPRVVAMVMTYGSFLIPAGWLLANPRG
ncbi:MAPEG family protein [Luteimonas salinilitoris]|uniref:MAPEG family protein n=1 Tax=Luteimonas salinilitoris TaxID=3237697 RepID=A0ABV4HVM9_9GAMM